VRSERASVALPGGATAKLAAFEALIRRWNPRSNLVARGDMGYLRERHTADSLALLPWVAGRLADVGAGAGLPGIPLAIARPSVPVVLIERSTRKCAFLRHAVVELDLRNVDVEACDARGYAAPDAFDTVTVRAVAPPAQAWDIARHLLKPGGSALLQSGDRLSPSMFDGGEIVDEAAAGRGRVTVVRGTRAPRS
jgi:16S rRNA (guanine527-N7)-methyltransferase